MCPHCSSRGSSLPVHWASFLVFRVLLLAVLVQLRSMVTADLLGEIELLEEIGRVHLGCLDSS